MRPIFFFSTGLGPLRRLATGGARLRKSRWRCVPSTRRQDPGAPASLGEIRDAARAVARQVSPPIVIGHDAGALVALRRGARAEGGDRDRPAADGGSLSFLARLWLARWRGATLAPDEGPLRRTAREGGGAPAPSGPRAGSSTCSLQGGAGAGQPRVPTYSRPKRRRRVSPALVGSLRAGGSRLPIAAGRSRASSRDSIRG
jgi:hypothetical protein